MEVGPILRALNRNKLGPGLVAMQVAVTLAILVNAAFIAQTRWEKMTRPTGFDIDNIFQLISMGGGDSFDERAIMERDLEIMNAMPGVIAANAASHTPLSGSGWGERFTSSSEEGAPFSVGAVYQLSGSAEDTLGVKITAGRDLRRDELRYYAGLEPLPLEVGLVTQALADELFPDGEALGQRLYFSGENAENFEVVGIIEQMHGSWVGWDGLERNVIFPVAHLGTSTRYLVRTEPGQRDRLMAEVETALNATGDRRIIRRVETLEEIRADSYSADAAVASSLVVVTALLILVTGLGIVGLASFLVTERTKQIGTRRALGARKFHVVRYFLVENWLITTTGLTLGLALAVALNYWMVKSFEMPRLDPLLLPMGLLVIWGLGLFAALWPARRAARISPAVATRTV